MMVAMWSPLWSVIGECHSFEWAFRSPVISELGVFVRCVRRSVYGVIFSLCVCDGVSGWYVVVGYCKGMVVGQGDLYCLSFYEVCGC